MNIYPSDVCDTNTLITAAAVIQWVHLFVMTWKDANLFNVHQTGNYMWAYVHHWNRCSSNKLKITLTWVLLFPPTVTKNMKSRLLGEWNGVCACVCVSLCVHVVCVQPFSPATPGINQCKKKQHDQWTNGGKQKINECWSVIKSPTSSILSDKTTSLTPPPPQHVFCSWVGRTFYSTIFSSPYQ